MNPVRQAVLGLSLVLEKVAADAYADLAALENAEFGFDHNQLGKELLADWRMPKPFQAAIAIYEDPSKSNLAEGSRDWSLLHLLHTADYLAQMCLAAEPARNRMVSKLIFKAARLGVESDDLVKLGDAVVKEWHDWSKLFGIHVITIPKFQSLLEVAPLAPESSDAGELPKNINSSFRLRVLLVDDDYGVLMIMKNAAG